ncbi:MAG: hypothetical protein R3A78_09885 [Polyangiales bacterium]|nr:hypothetical protein [Myxococcales bacterium]
MFRFLLAAAVSVALTACGGTSGVGAVGSSHASHGREPVELELRTPDNVLVNVGDFRGQTMLLFLFATFDGVSQAALHPLARFTRHHPEVYVLGIAVQPTPKELLDAWKAALDPPFVVTYSPEDRLTSGTSELGAVGAIPTFIVLDAKGYEVTRESGMVSEARLEALVAEAQ